MSNGIGIQLDLIVLGIVVEKYKWVCSYSCLVIVFLLVEKQAEQERKQIHRQE